MTHSNGPTIEIDEHVKAVALFMTTNIPTARLVPVAKALGEMAPLLWGQYVPEHIHPLRVVSVSISAGDRHTQSNASESPLERVCVDDGSAVAAA